MDNDGFNEISTGAVLGGGIASALATWKQKRIGSLNAEIADFRNDVDDLRSDSANQYPSPEYISESAVGEIAAIASTTEMQLQAKGQEKHASDKYQKVFALKHGIDRLAKAPKPLENIVLLTTMASVEGVATGMFFNSSGIASGIGESLALGLPIAGVNVLLSAGIGGYVCGRYWNYGLRIRHADPIAKAKRWFARIGGIMTGAAVGTLLMASGIVRATGQTEGLSFSFENLAAAASDFHSLMLWGIGGSFSILAWVKGLSAFSDPYPGLSDATHAATECAEAAKKIYEDALADIEDISADAEDEIRDIADDIEGDQVEFLDEIREVSHQREQLLSAISQAEIDFSAFRAELITQYQMINDEHPPDYEGQEFDGEGLRALIPTIAFDIKGFATDFPVARTQASSSMTAAKTAALKTINAAYQQSSH